MRFRKSAERRIPVGDVIDKCRSSEGFPRASSSSYMMVITMLMVQNYVFDDEDLLPSYGRGQPLMWNWVRFNICGMTVSRRPLIDSRVVSGLHLKHIKHFKIIWRKKTWIATLRNPQKESKFCDFQEFFQSLVLHRLILDFTTIPHQGWQLVILGVV